MPPIRAPPTHSRPPPGVPPPLLLPPPGGRAAAPVLPSSCRRVRSLNIAASEADARPVLVPGGNKAPAAAWKPSPKPLRKAPEKPPAADPVKEDELQGVKKDAGAATAVGDDGARKGNSSPLPPPRKLQDAPAVNLNASCSSEAPVESLRGQAPGGRTEKGWSRPTAPKRGKAASKVVEKHTDVAEVAAPVTPEAVRGRSRCAWVTPTTVGDAAAICSDWGRLERLA
ncbi:hypothetical protein VPH35_056422 [Triticum aestivum]|uniref:Uncharacterized protein n=1 Tax=Triticum aestivum TaxID=4565 RepID=A0A3B6FYF9_WHEAT|nr:translation initiation factor IF-2-like isoform X1 [Triticum aestivum]